MITWGNLESLATKYQTARQNTLREYIQHLFLAFFYKRRGSEKILFKGGTALRFVYGSPRFSEDLDFSSFGIESSTFQKFIEDKFLAVLEEIKRVGIEVDPGEKSGPTTGGYRGEATFALHGYSTDLEINISQRNKRAIKGEVVAITSDFIPPYNLHHLPGELLVGEKIDAFFERKKPRDFYDLYFMLRKGLVSPGQKERLRVAKSLVEATKADFSTELKAFLPKSHHPIIGQLKERLLEELTRQLAARE